MCKRLISLSVLICILLSLTTQALANNGDFTDVHKSIVLLSSAEAENEGEDPDEADPPLIPSPTDEDPDNDPDKDREEEDGEEEEEDEKKSYLDIILALLAATMVGLAILLIFLNRKKVMRPSFGGKSKRSGKAQYYLIGNGKSFADQRFPVTSDILIGRDPSRCNILFPENTQGVSSLHCEVTLEKDGLILVDKGSTYGTFMDDQTKLLPNTPYYLEDGDSFHLGTSSHSFRVEEN